MEVAVLLALRLRSFQMGMEPTATLSSITGDYLMKTVVRSWARKIGVGAVVMVGALTLSSGHATAATQRVDAPEARTAMWPVHQDSPEARTAMWPVHQIKQAFKLVVVELSPEGHAAEKI
jgi:hypothetical protein